MKKLNLKLKNKNLLNESGMALIWSLLTIVVLLLVSSSMATLIIKESKMSVNIDGSVRAYSAAESGISHFEYIIENTNCINLPRGFAEDPILDATEPVLSYNVKVEDANCAVNNNFFRIESTGKYGNITRKIQKTIDKSNLEQPSFNLYTTDPGGTSGGTIFHPMSSAGIASIPTQTSSYTQIIKMRTTSNWSSGKSIKLGSSVGNSAANSVYVNFVNNVNVNCPNGGSINYGVALYAGGQCATKSFSAPGLFQTDKTYILKIVYQKQSAVKVEVYEGQNLSADSCKLKFSTALPATGLNLNLDNVYYSLNSPNSSGFGSGEINLGNTVLVDYVGFQVN